MRPRWLAILVLSAACGGGSAAPADGGGKLPDGASADRTPATGSPGVWEDVTPGNAVLDNTPACGNYGVQTLGVDPRRPSDVYASFNCQGIWKSTDYGASWIGPINTGTGGPDSNGAGGLAIADGGAGKPPILYVANIRGGIGFWRSTDGGVSFTHFDVAPGAGRQDFYPPVVDPYDPQHLIMTGHEMNLLVESVDGGQTWTSIPTAAGMQQSGGTAFLFFLDTGSAASTRTTWLWMGQGSNGDIGTWRKAGAGAWTQVDKNEHPHGGSQIYQAGGGVVYMAGIYSGLGWGVLRSADLGQHWTHVGGTGNEATVWGTPSKVYAGYGWACGIGCDVTPSLESAPQPGDGTWTPMVWPAAMKQGPGAVVVTSDGTHQIMIGAMWLSGLWRYLEP